MMTQSNQPVAPITRTHENRQAIGLADDKKVVAFKLELLEVRIAPACIVKLLDKATPL
jgi:hypothetical protein